MSNSGWGGVFKNSHSKIIFESNKSGNSSKGGGSFSLIKFGTVINVNLDPGPNNGLVTYSTPNGIGYALSLSPSIKAYPVVGEIVIIIDASSIKTGNLSNLKPNYLQQTNAEFYIGSLNIWNNSSFNGVEQSNFFFPQTYIENVKPLQFFPGDVILDGRFGNSIRLGSTFTIADNDWSYDGTNGNPITIISNGQPKHIKENPIELTTIGDLKNSLSSLYLTSYQKISNFKLANNSFQSYDKKPEYTDQYKSPQIILNSTRVILNANQDSVLISGEKSVSLSSNQSINFDSKKIYMNGTDIRLGTLTKSEPVLLGDKTVDELVKMADAIKQIAEVVSTLKTYKGGKEAVDPSNSIGFSLISEMEGLINTLKDESKGIKSNFVKTI